MLSPCVDCDRRTMSCHTKCEQYREFQSKIKVIREKRFKEKNLSDYFFHAKKRKH